MSNPFAEMLKRPKAEDLAYDEWGGQFSCQERYCDGWANVARYFPKAKLLTWVCQEDHISKIDNIS